MKPTINIKTIALIQIILLCTIVCSIIQAQQFATLTLTKGTGITLRYTNEVERNFIYTVTSQKPIIKIPINAVTILNIDNHLPIIVTPNETILLSNENNEIKFTNTNNNINVLIAELAKKYGRFDDWTDNFSYPYPNIQTKVKAYNIPENKKKSTKFFTTTDRERDSLLYTLYSNRIGYIKQFVATRKVDEIFITFLKNYLKYQYVFVSFYGIYKPNIEQKLPAKIEQFLQQNKDEIYSGKYLYIQTYREFLRLYCNYLNYATKKNNTALSQMQTTLKYFGGTVKDYLLFFQLVNRYNKEGLAEQKEMVKLFKSNTEPSIYTQEVDNLILVKNIKKSTATALNINKIKFDLDELLRSKKDSIVYVDFWASWCMPCREEFKYYEALLSKYKEKKITFLFISLDKNFMDYSTAFEQYTNIMNDKNSFLLMDGFESSFIQERKIKSIPTYFIVSKGGNILYNNAPRPSEKRLDNLLLKLL